MVLSTILGSRVEILPQEGMRTRQNISMTRLFSISWLLVLLITTGISGELAGCLILAWVLVYCCVVKGVKSSGKVHYYTMFDGHNEIFNVYHIVLFSLC